MLQPDCKNLHILQIPQIFTLTGFELFLICFKKVDVSPVFFALARKVRHAAVVKFIGYFSQGYLMVIKSSF